MKRLVALPLLLALLVPVNALAETRVETHAAAPRVVSAFGRAFSPSTLKITPGTRVTFRNGDRVMHRLASSQGLWEPKELAARISGREGGGNSFALTFDRAGTFDYYCTIHSRMRGTIFVRTSR